MMLKGFPSSQSTITADTARVYLFAVEELPLEVVKRACRMFVRGEIAGRNNSFAPSAPELVEVCKKAEAALKWEQFEAEHSFIEYGSPAWNKLLLLKHEHDFPTRIRDGKMGWFFANNEVAEAAKLALPPPITAEQQAENRAKLRQHLGSRFLIGDPDAENGDMGQLGKAS